MIEAVLAKVHQALNRLGLSTDAASSTGSLHAKASDIRNQTGASGDAASATGSLHAKLTDNTNATGHSGDAASSTGSLHGKVLDLRNQVGATSDAASSTGSVNAKLVDIKNALNNQGTSALATSSQASDIRNNMVVANSGSIIKSVQRGTTNVGSGASVTVNISSVNMSKAMVNMIFTSNGYANAVLTSSTTLVLTQTYSTNQWPMSWEVIEYV